MKPVIRLDELNKIDKTDVFSAIVMFIVGVFTIFAPDISTLAAGLVNMLFCGFIIGTSFHKRLTKKRIHLFFDHFTDSITETENRLFELSTKPVEETKRETIH